MLKYAGFFIVDINNKVLILKKYNNLYTGPGGHLEFCDKTSKKGAIRELKEETNIDYHKLEILEEKNWTYNKILKLFVIKVKEIPKVTLSDEHKEYKKIKINNLNKYSLAYNFKNTLENNIKLLNNVKI